MTLLELVVEVDQIVVRHLEELEVLVVVELEYKVVPLVQVDQEVQGWLILVVVEDHHKTLALLLVLLEVMEDQVLFLLKFLVVLLFQ
jgi:hypothetical protein